MNLSMWEDLKNKIIEYQPLFPGDSMMRDNVLGMMEDIEEKNNMMFSIKEMELITTIFDVDGVVEIEVIFPENECTICNVFYDPDSDEMRDAHWRKILNDKSAEILYDTDGYVEFYHRRKKKKPFWRRSSHAR